MKKPNSFISIFKAEHYKSKSNIAVLSFLLCSFIATSGAFIYITIKTGSLLEYNSNPWINLIGKNLLILYLFYPFLASVLAYALCDMEYKNRNFQRLFTLPFSINTLFASKIIFLTEIVFVSTLIAYLSFLFSGFVLSHVFPALSFQDYDIRLACFYFHFRLYISLLAVSFIQFWLSLICRNFVIPIGFGGFMTLFSLLIMNKEYSYLNPFVAVFNSMNDFIGYQSISLSKHDYVCFVFIFIFIFVNLFTLKRQKNRK